MANVRRTVAMASLLLVAGCVPDGSGGGGTSSTTTTSTATTTTTSTTSTTTTVPPWEPAPVLVSRDGSGEPLFGGTAPGGISDDALLVPVLANHLDLAPLDAPGVALYGLGDGTRTRLSSTPGTAADLSGDGRFVLVGDDDGLWLVDRTAGTRERMDVATDGTPADGPAYVRPGSRAISDDGRFVVFSSFASNLGGTDANGTYDVFVSDRTAGTTTPLSRRSDGATGDGASFHPSISRDGRYVVFSSQVSDLGPGQHHVWRVDLTTGVVVGLDPATVEVDGRVGEWMAGGQCVAPGLSADGATFAVSCEYLFTNDAGDGQSIQLAYRGTVGGPLVPLDPPAALFTGPNQRNTTISDDGGRVVFESLGSSPGPFPELRLWEPSGVRSLIDGQNASINGPGTAVAYQGPDPQARPFSQAYLLALPAPI